jgi:hypothetical protein
MGTRNRSIGTKVKAAVAGVALVASGVALSAGTAGAAGGAGDGNLKAIGQGTAVMWGDFTSGTIRGEGVLVVVDPDHNLQFDVANYREKREGGAVTFYLGWSGPATVSGGDGIIGVFSLAGMGMDVTGNGHFRLEGRGVWDTEPGGAGFWGSQRRPVEAQI